MDRNDLNEKQIKEKADELAKKLYEENKSIIDDITNESSDVLQVNETNLPPYKEKRKKTKKNIMFCFLGICAITLILILIISNILSLGNNIAKNNVYMSYVFYGIVIVLILILIIIPLFEMLFLPSYNSLFFLEEKNSKEKLKANIKKIKLIAKKHESKWIISLNDKQLLKYQEAINNLNNSKDEDILKKSYKYIYKNFIKKDVIEIITSYSNKIFISTAVVQSGKIDSFIMFGTYFKMSKDVLKYCGFKISFVRLMKLSINILTMVYAATKLNQVDFTAIFPKVMMGYLEKIPGAKTVVNSLSDGVFNALLFHKTAVMLEEYLLSDNQNLLHQWAVSIKEAAKYMLVGLVSEILKKIVEFASFAVKKTIVGITTFFTTISNQILGKKENNKQLSSTI